MHLGNGIICPVTGIPMLAFVAGTAFWAFKNARKEFGKEKISKVVTLTALVFAMQMINFAIPTTGSSGHIVGAILLAALLGPSTAFLAMCAILTVQSVFFADGGLMALGCNIFNMGFLACFVTYPLLFKPLADKNKPVIGAILASVVALQLGSIAVVAESVISGSMVSNIGMFTGLMQAIHLPIGIVEGLITASVIVLSKFVSANKMSTILGGSAFVLAGVIAQYASQKPDGLEWSLLNMSDSVVAQTQGVLYSMTEVIQTKLAIFNSLPTVFANLAGLFTVGILMYSICLLLNLKMVKVDAK